MIGKRRLSDIEKDLTCQQVVLAYLAEIMGRFDSYAKWSQWTAEHPEQMPQIVVHRTIRDALQERAKDRSVKARADAQSKAYREVTFLVLLFLDVMELIHACLKDLDLRASLCARGIQLLLLQESTATAAGEAVRLLENAALPDQLRGATSRLVRRLRAFSIPPAADEAGPAIETAGGPEQDADPAGAGLWSDPFLMVREQLWQCLGKACLAEILVHTISTNYFGGQPILFVDQRRQLADAVQTAGALADEYDFLVRMIAASPGAGDAGQGQDGQPVPNAAGSPLLNQKAVRQAALAAASGQLALVVRMAKARTLITSGEYHAGCDLASKALRGQPGAPGR